VEEARGEVKVLEGIPPCGRNLKNRAVKRQALPGGEAFYFKGTFAPRGFRRGLGGGLCRKRKTVNLIQSATKKNRTDQGVFVTIRKKKETLEKVQTWERKPATIPENCITLRERLEGNNC